MKTKEFKDAIFGLDFTVKPNENRDKASIYLFESQLATVDFARQSIEIKLCIKWDFRIVKDGWIPAEIDLEYGLINLNYQRRKICNSKKKREINEKFIV
jgi:hypothetical protein